MFTERTQVLLSKDQLARLRRIARRERRSVGAVIRDALDAYTATPADRRRASLRQLFELDAPVDEWQAMKDQIVDGATGRP
jgi:hypothetical protein